MRHETLSLRSRFMRHLQPPSHVPMNQHARNQERHREDVAGLQVQRFLPLPPLVVFALPLPLP